MHGRKASDVSATAWYSTASFPEESIDNPLNQDRFFETFHDDRMSRRQHETFYLIAFVVKHLSFSIKYHRQSFQKSFDLIAGISRMNSESHASRR